MATATLSPPAAPPRAAPPLPARATGNGAHAPKSVNIHLGAIAPTTEPPRIALNAVEGWGKTTVGANMPKPVILMAKGETGYRTLLSRGLVPQCDGALIESWPQLLATIDHLIETDTGHESVVLDATGGFERLCHEHVCQRDYKGDFGDKGFGSYNKGYETSIGDWLQLLHRLDRLREARGMAVMLLSHVKVKTFKNPMGEDFDRYIVDCHEKTWGVTGKWLDAILFGNFFTVVDKARPQDKKGKGIGGTERVIYTQHHDAYEAKNRFAMPEVIDIPNDPAQAWATIHNAITGEPAHV